MLIVGAAGSVMASRWNLGRGMGINNEEMLVVDDVNTRLKKGGMKGEHKGIPKGRVLPIT